EDAAANRRRGILGDDPTERAALLEGVVPLPSTAAGVTEREAAARTAVKAEVFIPARIRVANAMPRRQFEMQESLVALECDARSGESLVVLALDRVHRLT